MTTSKQGLSRDEAAELYRDLQKTMKQMKGVSPKDAAPATGANAEVAKQIAAAIKQGMADDDRNGRAEPKASRRKLKGRSSSADIEQVEPVEAPSVSPTQREYLLQGLQSQSGIRAAIVFVLFFAVCKFSFSALEASGVLGVQDAQASLGITQQVQSMPGEKYSKEEVKILTSLDARREDLRARDEKLQEQIRDLESREREFAVRLTELRDLSQKLSVQREQNERRRDGQLEQLANVYGSMNPKEASILIEQLDITIAIGLLERMPEKRIGQILSLMSPDRALTMTRMLSGRD